jgi:hypothetical protein
MKSFLVFFSILLAAAPCAAQRGAIRGANVVPVAPVGVGGFGNVLHPGTGSPGLNTARGFAGRGVARSTGFFGGYPLYGGGAYGSSYAPGDYSSQTQLNPQQQQSAPGAPPVVINQYFAPPPLPPPPVTSGFYQPSGDRPQQDEDSSSSQPAKYYLLAFKDHSVYSALAYWVEDKTLHYVTTNNTHNQVSLDLVDLEFTQQLNRDRDVPFSIKTPSK